MRKYQLTWVECPTYLVKVLILLSVSLLSKFQLSANDTIVKDYYTQINRAEMFIVNHKLDSAYKIYDSQQIESLSLKDLNNFLEVSYKLNKSADVIAICNQMAINGVGEGYF